MNANQIINLVIRIFMRKAINSGIKAGMNVAGKRGRSRQPAPEIDDYGRARDQEPGDREPPRGRSGNKGRGRSGKGSVQASAQQARKMARVSRRLTRM